MRSSFVLAASVVVLAAAGGGCASEDISDVDFVGTYRPTSGGGIDAIVFSENKDYLLMPAGCRSQSCAELGRFHFDGASKLLALTAATTGRTRYLPVEVIETSGGAAKTSGSLVSTKSQQLLNGGGQQLTTGKGEKLAESGQQLIESILKALIDMQGMQKDDGKGGEKDDPKADEEKKDEEKPFDLECQQNVPNALTPGADVVAYWQRCPQGVVTRQK